MKPERIFRVKSERRSMGVSFRRRQGKNVTFLRRFQTGILRKPFGIPAVVVALLAVAIWASSAWASIDGKNCSLCHTMHYSQDRRTDWAGWGADGPYPALLINNCIGCHTGINDGTGDTPYVYSTSEPSYGDTGTEADTNTLAGGNFYWMAMGNDAVGHNVASLNNPDDTLGAPPGFDSGRSAADGTIPGNGSWIANPITCAGTYGCHGRHDTESEAAAIRGGHHGNAGGAITAQSIGAGASYRMLVGITGYEDPDREYRPTAEAHNQYQGVDAPGNPDDSTISYLCAQCHGQFHGDASDIGSSSPWLRHPTDYDMGNTAVGSEYRAYADTTGTPGGYNVIAPVGSADVGTVRSSVSFADDTIVTCISCHRAHGTPHYKIMRWDYAGSSFGGSCSVCHTSKN